MIRACLHSSRPEHDGDKVDHRGEAYIGFFLARRDASKHLDIAEEVFDKVAPLILFRVMGWVSGGDCQPEVARTVEATSDVILAAGTIHIDAVWRG